jgi:hypothetical protein
MFEHLKNLFEESMATATVVHDVRTSDTVRVAVHPARPLTDNAYKVSNESRTRTDLLGTTTDQERVKTNRRVGAEGEKTRGKVGEKAAAARGPGKETTDLQADSVSLATPASGPQPRDDNTRTHQNPTSQVGTTTTRVGHHIATTDAAEQRRIGR